MLHFHHSHHRIDFSYIIEELKPHHQLQFAPISDDGDELGQAIANDFRIHGNDWELTKYPDTHELGEFWEKVEKDLSLDNEETDFTD